ncbi:MAG: aminopeptidase [Lachnospiraceae bacterium]
MSNAWTTYDEKNRQELNILSESYKRFTSEAKIEREIVKKAVAMAKTVGYRDLKQVVENEENLRAGDKVYYISMNKAVAFFQIGTAPITEGMRIIGGHIDSPRLDIKQNPLYESDEMAYLDTHYYGGIKKYLWVTIPMELRGTVVKMDGSSIDVCVGADESDPVVGVTDLLIHMSGKLMVQKASEVVEGENLDLLIGSEPLTDEEKEPVKAQILKILKEKYDIEEDDFMSAELEAVPAGKARDFGLDRSMIMAYGHDDKVNSWAAFQALLDTKSCTHTTVCIFADKEEVGSIGATGMQSCFFEDAVAEIVDRMGIYSNLNVRRALRNSKMLSSDVAAAYDPIYASVSDKKNIAYMGHGIAFVKYTGSYGKNGANDASAEYMGWLRRLMEENKVVYQTSELGKVDAGGGGTIAYILARYGMEVIDAGVPVLSMHSPYELCSKADLYETVKAFRAFYLS